MPVGELKAGNRRWINVETGEWTNTDSHISGAIDVTPGVFLVAVPGVQKLGFNFRGELFLCKAGTTDYTDYANCKKQSV